MQSVALDADDIRTLTTIINKSRDAQTRMAVAAELAAELLAQLRVKYGLGDEWQCHDILIGFVRDEGTAPVED